MLYEVITPAAADADLDAVDPRTPVLVTATALFRAGADPDTAHAAAGRLRFANAEADGNVGVNWKWDY